MYVDGLHKRETDQILLVERVGGKRVFKQFPAKYTLYYTDPKGSHKSIYGDTLSKYVSSNLKAFNREKNYLQEKHTIFESDINPVFRCLEENYLSSETPSLHIGFFDIEVAFDTKKGFAPTEDPFNNVTAISVYLNWSNTLVTLVLPPPTMTLEEAELVTQKFENCILFDDEAAMLSTFLDLIDDCDVLTGWNSTGFDIPYLVNRITRVLGKEETVRFCLWNQLPKRREYIKFKKKSVTYDLVGRVHLDYLELYQKHNPQQLHSYRLDFVGEVEVGENKTQYEGTLDDLYKKDFERFIEYNRQDVMLMVKIDQKKKFIELANQIAHTNTVLLKTTMGSVALIEQAITNYAHQLGMVVPDRKSRDEEVDDDDIDDDDDEFAGDAVEAKQVKAGAVGAYVAKPKTGIQDEIGCCDINSLYPSTLRALNMSPETLVGHIRPEYTEAMIQERIAAGTPKSDLWEGVFCTLEYEAVRDRTKKAVTVDFADGTTVTMRGDELNDFIFHDNRPLAISANGTIFRTDINGVIPGLLAEWYAQRKTMQGREKVWATLGKEGYDVSTINFEGVIAGSSTDIRVLPNLIKEGNADVILALINEHDLQIVDGKLKADKAKAAFNEGFWNQRQQARKILLNSLYGALLNESMKFYDKRIGQSVTLTGRSIARHMNSKINEIITGEYDYKGDAIIYADTDSSYFSAYKVWKNDERYKDFEFTRDNVVKLYDAIGDEVNDSFPEFMNNAFNTGLSNGGIIAAGRELVASKGLFIKKKKYAVLMYDKEGFRYDTDGKPGKLKVMGLDLKRSDTPQFMQDFLEEVLMDSLTGSTKDEIFTKIKAFRREFRNRPGWEKGTPKKVNGLTDYAEREQKAKSMRNVDVTKIKSGEKTKVNMPGHVRAAMNWNKLKELYGDRFSMGITDGSKVIVCKLKPNALKMDSVAYPVDEPHIPQWFKDLPFDHSTMESTIIDFKLDNLFGVLKWDLSMANDDISNDDLFTWG